MVEEVFGINWRYKEFRPDTMLEAFREITDAFAALLERKGIATY